MSVLDLLGCLVGAAFFVYAVALALWVDRRESGPATSAPGRGPAPGPPSLRLVR